MNDGRLRVALLQTDILWEDPAGNFAHAERWIATAAAAGARLALLPEMFSWGFSMDTQRVSEPPEGPSTRFLSDAAGRHGIWVGGSLPELAPGADRPYNTLLLAGPDGTAHRYRKLRPFTYAGEDRAYRAGDAPVTVEIEGLRLTLFVCYDLRFADLFWAAAPHTDAYVVVANWPETRRDHWRLLLRARAIENQAYVMAVNRVGKGGPRGATPLRYVGDSAVVGPGGELLASASEVETMLLAEIDAAEVRRVREALPFLRDRR